ncbi:MAG: 16S rRNA (cytidine(1402)-2'-O)-methyltransferase [Candidatus Eisenbacteria bacterium]|uniref:Ribosomal RNA small subunit methyltransferase I n=1 Tax=Eiseniibacteriota bacterium TaxID=2212470 RepID=A0A538U865_UNCEI|nr:MAG: 16S rRNA (cytidine(1402)-2'-O)-methyltransferase [Candidatus Eisenbacteria bacterium]
MTREQPSGGGGTLFLVATPIGNLEDISRRALRVLGEVQVVAAEDTRHTRRLLEHFGIGTPVVSLFEHNERAKIPSLLKRLEGGGSVAVVTDAGSPGVSDPGYPLARAAAGAGFRVESIPGPSAVIAALQVSGLPTDAFLFVGFLPPKRAARRRRLEELHERRETIVAFESPHRIDRCLEDLEAVWGDRPIALARELTKLHEQVLRGTPRQVRAALGAAQRRGEMVLVLGGRLRARGGAGATGGEPQDADA